MTPERTKNVPNKLKAKVKIANIIVQALNTPRFSVTANECNNATPPSQGINDAFSTGSQNHQPPQPSSLYAHMEPNTIPNVKQHQAASVQGRDQRVQTASNRPAHNAAMAKANGTTAPT